MQVDLFALEAESATIAPVVKGDSVQVDAGDVHAVAADLWRRELLSPVTLGREWLVDGANAGITRAREWLFENYALSEDGTWLPVEEFFHGDAFAREASLLAAAEAADDARVAAKYREQAQRFRSLVKFESLEDVLVTPRDSFVPLPVLQRFVNEVLSTGPSYRVERNQEVVYVLGPQAREIDEFREYLNHATNAGYVEREGKTKEEYAAERNAMVDRARALEARFEDQFRVWLYSSPYRDEVELAYNRTFNSFIPPQFADVEIEREVPGWASSLTPHWWQREAVQRILQAGGGIIGLDVGLGKTLAGVMLVMIMRARGSVKRPIVVVPKSLVAKWRDAFREAVPSSKVLVVGQSWRRGRWQDDSAKAKARKLRLAVERDYDAVIVTREAFSSIPLRVEQLDRLVEQDPELVRHRQLQEGMSAYQGQFRFHRNTVSLWVEQHRKRYEDLAWQMAATGEPVTYWDDLADFVLVDEAHAYKNMHAPVTVFGQTLKYAGQGEASDRAMDFYWKAETVRGKRAGKGVALLTASIVKNSPMELYSLTKQAVGPKAIPGVSTLREFVRRYMEIESAVVLDSQGEVAGATAVVGFQNLQELRGLMQRFIYRKTAREVGMPLPEVETCEHFFEMDEDVRSEYTKLARQINGSLNRFRVRAKRHRRDNEPAIPSIFELYAGMRKLTLEPALQNRRFAGRRNPRFELAARLAADAVRSGGRVLMFMDMGQNHEQGAGSRHVNAYERVVEELARAGVDRSRVRVATASTLPSAQSRRALEVDYENGKIDVIIGSTGVIGEGVDLQAGTTDIVHLDTPWDPGGYWQRMGRAVRQGSQVERVRAHVLVARGSFDSIMFATMLGKRAWMEVLLEGSERRAPNSNVIDPREELLASLSKDPELALARVREVKQQIYEDAAKVRTREALIELRHLGALASSLQRARELLERNRGSAGLVEHMEKRVEFLSRRYKAQAAVAVRDPDLPEPYREAVLSERPFIIDVGGRFYAPGSVFLYRVKGLDALWSFQVEHVDLANLKVRFRPLVAHEKLQESYVLDVADLAGSSQDHAPDFTPDVLRPVLKKLGYKEHGRLPVELVESVEQFVQDYYRNHPSEGTSYVVTASGWIEERNLHERPLQANERLLLNTSADRSLFEDQFFGLSFPFAA